MELSHGDAFAVAGTRAATMISPVSWIELSPAARRRAALAYAEARDSEALWALTATWLEHFGRCRSKMSAHTARTYRQGMQQLLVAWSEEDLLRPRPAAADRWLASLGTSGRGPATARGRLSAARALYAALRWAGATDADPFRDIRLGGDTRPESGPVVYSQEEVGALVACAEGEDRVLILLAAHGGLRSSECLALQWVDVELPGRTALVRDIRGHIDRQIPLSKTLAHALSTTQPDAMQRFILPYRSDMTARARLSSVARAAGVGYRGLRALRHACGLRLVGEARGDLASVARVLGCSTAEVLRLYTPAHTDSGNPLVHGW